MTVGQCVAEYLNGDLTMNETLKVIAERYTCRDYKDEMPSDEILQAIAEAAIEAPSGMNRQAWRVIVVKDRALIPGLRPAHRKQCLNAAQYLPRC